MISVVLFDILSQTLPLDAYDPPLYENPSGRIMGTYRGRGVSSLGKGSDHMPGMGGCMFTCPVFDSLGVISDDTRGLLSPVNGETVVTDSE